MHFLEENGFQTPWASSGQQSCFRTFCLGANFLPFYEKKNSSTFQQKMSDQFFSFYAHILGHISSILVIKQVLDNIFYSTIVTYNFCMIPHSSIFSFNFTRFGLKQNPTGLQEAIQRSDKNSKTTLIIKSTLEWSFLMKKTPKNHFWNIALFTRFNLSISQDSNITLL